MAGEWAYLVSGAAQARTAAPTPPIGRSQILAIRRQVGKVSLARLLSQFGHESDIRHRRGDSSKSDEQWQPILFLRRGPLLPDGSVFSLPSFANDRFQLLGTSRRATWQRDWRTSIKRTIRRHQLREMVPLADSTIYEMEQRGEFPRRFALSPRCVVWDLSEVEAWLASRRSAPIARAQHPDVTQRRSRPVKAPGRAPRAASTAE